MYIYINESLSQDIEIYTVGFYHPNGAWIPEGSYQSKEAASARVNYLNGGLGHISKTQTKINRGTDR